MKCEEGTNKRQTTAKQNKRQRLLLELKGNGQFAEARETKGKTTNKHEKKNKQTTDKSKRRKEKREERNAEPILWCSEEGVRVQGQSTFATRHSFPLRTVRRANVA